MSARLRFLAAIAWLLAAPRAAGEAPGAPPARIGAVGEIGLTVSDCDRAAEFYGKVLGFEKVGEEVEIAGSEYERLQGVFGLRMRAVRVRLGEEVIVLTEYLAPRGQPFPPGSRGNDLWFQHIAIVVSDMDRAYRRLREHRVEHASPGPQRLPDWNPRAGGIEAFYFRDPDGHFLELIRFPEGKGDLRWRRGSEDLFLGIDHTAIVVSDTERSLAFYRDALGMDVSGSSENHGIEQERLNGVFGARLRITALHAPAGPGIELLEYLAPGDGRTRPAGACSNDLLHWQTSLAVGDAASAAAKARSAGGAWLSPGAVTVPGEELGFRRGALVADPDGHALLLVEHGRASTSHALGEKP